MTMMKTAVIRPGSRVEIIDEEVPVARGNLAVVKVLSAPMCTEYYHYRNGTGSLCLGHEAAGEVVEVAAPGTVKAGDRVVVMPQYPCGNCELCRSGDYIHCEHVVDPFEICGCNSGKATYSQYVVKQDWLLIPVPDTLSLDHASMACCGLGASFGAVNRLRVNSSDTVLITGLGPVGLGAVINCVSRGARVIGIARNPYRARLAMELGAEVVLDTDDPECIRKIRELTGNLGADKSIDCSGGGEYQKLCLKATRRRGELALVGESKELSLSVSDDLIRSGLTVHGCWHWNLSDTAMIMDTITRNTDKINKLITHSFPLTEVEDAFKLQVTGNCGKVILHPWAMARTKS
jgi:L-iditol 2-dehydrogenase